MDDIEFHGEPPSPIPTMVAAFGGWVDAGEAATGALRSLVRQLGATPLATIDPETFVDFTTIRPVVRLNAAGERTIRAVRSGPGRRPRAAAVAIIGGKERTTREG